LILNTIAWQFERPSVHAELVGLHDADARLGLRVAHGAFDRAHHFHRFADERGGEALAELLLKDFRVSPVA
jgi:hypothetical protein